MMFIRKLGIYAYILCWKMNVTESFVETSGFVVAAVCYNIMFNNSLLQYHVLQ